MRRRRGGRQSGQALVLGAILLAFVVFGFLGFAVDLGRLYLIRGELHVAAEAMALAAAQELIGTEDGMGRAEAAVNAIQASGEGSEANKYDFGGATIGEGAGALISEVRALELYEKYTEATDPEMDSLAPGPLARFVRVRVRAEAPLTFWQLLPSGQSGVTMIETAAVAGPSAPLCSACGIEPLVVQPPDAQSPPDFGFLVDRKYTLYTQCTPGLPLALEGTSGSLPYTVLRRAVEGVGAGAAPLAQVFRASAAGLPGPAWPLAEDTAACPTIAQPPELRAPQIVQRPCATPLRDDVIRATLCGLGARLTSIPAGPCADLADQFDGLPPPDTPEEVDTYSEYEGNRRRILTVAVSISNLPLNVDGQIVIGGFRQFLLEPHPASQEVNAADPFGRFVARYIGSAAPIKQGRVGSCGQTEGPGKVVLH